MAERFKETVQIRPVQAVGINDNSLINQLESFGQQKLQERQQDVAQASFAAGQQAFQEGDQPEFKQERFFGKVGSKAYNQGLRASYVASLDRDNRERISEMRAQNPANLAAFNDQSNEYRKAVLQNVDPTARQVVSDSLDSLISSNRIAVQTNEIRKTHDENDLETASHVDSATNDALAFARDGNDIGAAESALVAFAGIDGRVDAEFISEKEGALLKRGIEKDLIEENLKGGLFRTFDDVGQQEALDELDDLSDKVPKGFAPEEWDQFISGAQTDLNRKSARQKQNLKASLKAEQLENSVKRGFLFTNPDIPADPAKSSQDRKDVNNYYDSISPEWRGNVNDLINNNVEFVKNTGLVPDQLVSNMNAVMRSGNTEQAIAMMEAMQRIQETSPNSIKDFSGESRAMSLQVSDSMRNGLDAETAVEVARKNTYGLSPTQKDELKIAADEAKPMKRFEEMVSDEFDPFQFPVIGFLRNEPDIPPGMQATFKSNFNDFMSITSGNVEQAEKLAFESTKNIWAVSSTGGPRRFMRFAPEGFYHVEGFDDSWISDQFLEDTEVLGIQDAIIGTDDQVARSDRPSYPILAPNQDGILDVIEDENGKPQRFQPDIKLTQQYIDLTEAPGKAVEKAKQKRQFEIERRANIIRRQIIARVFSYDINRQEIPPKDRAEFLNTDDGKARVKRAITLMFGSRSIDDVEADQTLQAFGLGSLEELDMRAVLSEQ